MGAIISAILKPAPPEPTFKPEDIADLTGKIVIVTGGNTGLGKETIRVLLQHNATVYLAARTASKAKEAIDELKESTGKEARFLQLDLADLKSVKEAARQFKEKEKELHILVNNAGVMICPVDQVTKDNYDMQFGTNVLGHYYFTKLLLPELTAAGSSRVVTVSSDAGLYAKTVDFNTLKDGPARRKLSNITLYNQSKLGNFLFTLELKRRYSDKGIVSVSLHPGTIAGTELPRHVSNPILKVVLKILPSYPMSLGILSSLYAATHPDGESLNGKYLVPWAREGSFSPAALDEKLGSELWKWMEEQVAPLES